MNYMKMETICHLSKWKNPEKDDSKSIEKLKFINIGEFDEIEKYQFGPAATKHYVDTLIASLPPVVHTTKERIKSPNDLQKNFCRLSKWRFFRPENHFVPSDCRHKICLKYTKLLNLDPEAAQEFHDAVIKTKIVQLKYQREQQDCRCCESSDKYCEGYHCPCCRASNPTTDSEDETHALVDFNFRDYDSDEYKKLEASL